MKNFLTAPCADPALDDFRNKARRAALRSIRAEKKLAASHGTTADLEAAEAVAEEADAAFFAYLAAYNAAKAA